MEYTAVIRTLGTAGKKYQQLLDSLNRQNIRPQKIIVYIAEGYPIPKETIGWEQYVYVKKGMVAQRALPYSEVTTKYMLFLDDDVYLPEYAVEKLYAYLTQYNADIISPDVFPNLERPCWDKILMTLSGRMMARKDDGTWGYKVMCNAGYSYNTHPKAGVYWSQTNAGPCFFCSKSDFQKIRFEEELWLDKMEYALGDDQTMFYKMYSIGLKQLTWFHSGIIHLDAGTTLSNQKKSNHAMCADLRFKIIFWHRFIYQPETSLLKKIWSIAGICYVLIFTLTVSSLKLNISLLRMKWQAIKDGFHFIRSEAYRQLPRIKKIYESYSHCFCF